MAGPKRSRDGAENVAAAAGAAATAAAGDTPAAAAAPSGPLRVTEELLGITSTPGFEGTLEYDLGNLAVFHPSALDPAAFATGAAAACADLATALTQSLVARLFGLPSEAIAEGRLAQLPPPRTALPRTQPLPTPKLPTRWEAFAAEKGIKKRKRSKLVFEETPGAAGGTGPRAAAGGEWKRRHGYGKAGESASAFEVIEAGPGDAPGSDPFGARESEKKKRVAAQGGRLERNLRKSGPKNGPKSGVGGGLGGLPATLALSAGLPMERDAPGGGGAPARRDPALLKTTLQRAALATASLGKFDRKARGEAAGPPVVTGKRRAFLPTSEPRKGGGRERAAMLDAVDAMIRRGASSVSAVDVGKAARGIQAEKDAGRAAAKARGEGGARGRGRGKR